MIPAVLNIQSEIQNEHSNQPYFNCMFFCISKFQKVQGVLDYQNGIMQYLNSPLSFMVNGQIQGKGKFPFNVLLNVILISVLLESYRLWLLCYHSYQGVTFPAGLRVLPIGNLDNISQEILPISPSFPSNITQDWI